MSNVFLSKELLSMLSALKAEMEAKALKMNIGSAFTNARVQCPGIYSKELNSPKLNE